MRGGGIDDALMSKACVGRQACPKQAWAGRQAGRQAGAEVEIT